MSSQKLKLKITSSIIDLNDVLSPDKDSVAEMFEDEDFESFKEMDELEIRKLILAKLSEHSTEKTEILVDGELTVAEFDTELRYEQYSDDGLEKTLNRLVFNNKDKSFITLLRSGEIYSRMTFDVKRKFVESLYKLPFGQIRMNVFTKYLSNTITENGGKIELRYILEVVNGSTQYCELVIERKKK